MDQSPRPPTALITAALVLTITFVVASASHLLPLFIGQEHGFATIPPPLNRRTWLPLLGTIALLGWFWRSQARPFARPWHAVSGAVVLGWLTIMAGILAIPSGPAYLAAVMLCEGSNSYFAAALQITEPAEFLATFPERMHLLGQHAATQSAGLTLLHWLLWRLFRLDFFVVAADTATSLVGQFTVESVAIGIGRTWSLPLTEDDVAAAIFAGATLTLLGTAAALPLFGLVRRYASERAGYLAVALFLLMPGLWNYTPCIDQVYITIFAWAALALSRYLDRGPASRWAVDLRAFVLTGWLAGLALLLNFGFVVLPVWAAFLTALAWGRPPVQAGWQRLAVAGLGLPVGWLLGILTMYLALDYRVLEAIQQSHQAIAPGWGRTYWIWVLADWPEFFISAGWPVVLLAGAALWTGRPAEEPPAGPWRQLLAVGLLLLALDLSGLIRGEVSRMWLLYVPPLIVAGVCWLERHEVSARGRLALLLAQSIGAWGLYLFFSGWGVWVRLFYEPGVWR
ncbi:MAG: hypothetical protein HUU35_09090 [Armatimonadetes bacterium]|nr:hypothetical protein [Armatimonadota bacterium]